MIIIPAIDIMDGKPVRLYQGDYSKKELVAESVLDTAKQFASLGAEYIHLVDLDGAKVGSLVNDDIILETAKKVNVPIEVGGGIRSYDTIKKLLNGGVSRVILGTSAIENKEFMLDSINDFGDKIAIAVDCKNGFVCGRGWLKESHLHYIDFIKDLKMCNAKNVIVTDINKDGTLKGPNLDMLKKIQEEVEINITASGGISNIEDIRNLNRMNLYAAITGKAIYAKTLSLEEAIKVSKEE